MSQCTIPGRGVDTTLMHYVITLAVKMWWQIQKCLIFLLVLSKKVPDTMVYTAIIPYTIQFSGCRVDAQYRA